MAASPQRFMAPPMDVRLHGPTPEGGESILTPEALRYYREKAPATAVAVVAML